jgi:hypothetical protein
MTTIHQKRPVIAIFCKELKAGGDPFSNDFYWQAYQELFFALKAKGINVYFATDNNAYRGYGLFDVVYSLSKRGSINDLKPVEKVEVDLVFDRGGFIGGDVLMINPPIITKIAQSKIEMYEYFADFQPYSLVGNTKRQVEKAIERVPSDKVVVKEPEGYGGNEVYIGEKKDVLEEFPDRYPLLVQEFLDTSTGIPGQLTGVHDARVRLCGSEIVSYFLRSAEEGKYHANIAQGGEGAYLDVKDVPAELMKTAKLIDSLFDDQPRFYSLDFMHTEKGWKLIELNSYVGLMSESGGPQAKFAQEKLVGYLVAEAQKVYAQKLSTYS